MDTRTEHEKDLDALSEWLTKSDKTALNEWRSHMTKEAFLAGRNSLRQQLAKPDTQASVNMNGDVMAQSIRDQIEGK